MSKLNVVGAKRIGAELTFRLDASALNGIMGTNSWMFNKNGYEDYVGVRFRKNTITTVAHHAQS